VWYVFSGMGAHWPKMGAGLMTLDTFRESIMKSDAVLQRYNFHLCDVLNDPNEDAVNDIIKAASGIVAIQVCLHYVPDR
jgi:acyl transferase domain-containing protein